MKDVLVRAIHRCRFAIIPESRLGAFPLTQHIRSVIESRAIDTVIDVGANVGGFGRMMRRAVGFSGPIFSFEPVGAVFAELNLASAPDPDWSAFQTALGSAAGTRSINVTAASEFASFLTPKTNGMLADLSRVERQESVPVARLDDFLKERGILPERAYLKIDTQGSDLEVLRGATGILDRVQAIQTELSMHSIYEGAPSYVEALGEIGKAQFVISGMFPVTLSDDMVAIEMDAILVRDHGRQAKSARTYASVIKRGALLPRIGRRKRL